jgi:hypothetical protein
MSRLAVALVMAVFALGATTTAFACGTSTQSKSGTVAQADTTSKTTTTVKPEGGKGG